MLLDSDSLLGRLVRYALFVGFVVLTWQAVAKPVLMMWRTDKLVKELAAGLPETTSAREAARILQKDYQDRATARGAMPESEIEAYLNDDRRLVVSASGEILVPIRGEASLIYAVNLQSDRSFFAVFHTQD